MPFGWLKDMLDRSRKKRKPMGEKRKKLRATASKKSVAGTMRDKNAATKAALDEAGDY
jgi:hypothetical protein